MPANWGVYTLNIKREFGSPNQKDIPEIADIHATEYVSAVSTATISLTGSKVSLITKALIKPAFELVFRTLRKVEKPINPNYAIEEAQTEEEINSRKFLEDIFLPVSTAICASWVTEIFTPAIMPVGYVSPSPGYTVIFPGDPKILAKDLAKAFFVAQSIPDREESINKMIASFIEAYSKHLLTIKINFSGNILNPSGVPVLVPILPLTGIA